ncbi:hypothetical protein CDL12_09368 [Handroanthus impetiginosus]|uniref:Uncharacterized protein n=1 Tax=Handroanthus impetiginosus TaxID=429701 RepID=A0A2G9HL00_9LAMI|nr:hypothetical protein CDL12_09368 [Handroanthus impetiginosus]
MCFNLPFKFKKGKFKIPTTRNDEEREDVGLLVKEIEKWNKKRQMETTQGESDHGAFSSFSTPSKHKS